MKREDKGLRQEDVARLAGTSTLSYGKYERGERSMPVDVLVAALAALDIDFFERVAGNDFAIKETPEDFSIYELARVIERYTLTIQKKAAERRSG